MKTRQKPSRRRFVHALLGLVGVAIAPRSVAHAARVKPSPILQAYERLLDAQTEVLRLAERNNRGSGSMSYEVRSQLDEVLNDAVDRASQAEGRLINLLLEATGTPPVWLERYYDDDPQEPVAVHREGGKVWILAGCCPGSPGAYAVARSSASSIRVLVIDDAKGGAV